MCKSKISAPNIPGLLDSLFESPEHLALTRAEAILLAKARREKWHTNKRREKCRETSAGQYSIKVVSDMPMMKPSELLKKAVDDRIRGVLQRR